VVDVKTEKLISDSFLEDDESRTSTDSGVSSYGDGFPPVDEEAQLAGKSHGK
jgi:hypothetical protein